MLIKLAFNAKQQQHLKDVLYAENTREEGMSNAAKGALVGSIVPILGTGIGYLAGRKSDQKRRWRIEKLNHAMKHHDKKSVKDVLHQDDGEWHRGIKGFLIGSWPGAFAGQLSQLKKEQRNAALRSALGE